MDKILFLKERFIVSDVQVPSISEKLETPTEEMREGGIQREIEVQVHRAESEGSVDPHVVLAVLALMRLLFYQRLLTECLLVAKILLPRLGLLLLGSLVGIKGSLSAFRLQLNFLFI